MNLNNEIKQLIIDCLDLEDVSIDDIQTDAPLFGEGLGLDSIDALELGLAIKKKFDIKIEANSDATKAHFNSVASLARFIESQRP
ncbi:phosphopantetheine-binding protein [Shewanella glacialipiscicola]|uniref:Acyl carrier protein n=1 Tax=Shewanella glacialipiscicola TaxID=614069 RepID=A0ABQ6J8T5_9GAMM|nr:phosphopantetheine-binding protein [Shewanella glacialipiscicola]MCL1085594.1 phosphopantetheine-binding protein [Shewanella glacialipiscicola]MCU7994423.1 phosphopantetheine-binding protein [Shewanella glacialipiscicola]MCU8025894.1 phosphopantetheine-binding protein [Shewanella glacialipiscicola]GIU03610.1 acyl carrier protein [Shewanella glacialipiscicola]GMA83645.1 acyl carrier protein [Shewanella glacialipiscicola]